VKAKELAQMFRQLATLMEAGIPLVSSLSALIEQSGTPLLKTILTQIRKECGKEAAWRTPCRPTLRSSPGSLWGWSEPEKSADPGLTLSRWADFSEHQVALRQRIRAALTYPAFMFIIGGGSFLPPGLRGSHGDQDFLGPRPVPSLAHPDPDRGERLSQPILVGGGRRSGSSGLLAAEIPAQRVRGTLLGPPEIEASRGPRAP